MSKNIYWISVLIGILIFVYLFYESSTKEGFAAGCTLDASTGTAYKENMTKINPSDVLVYLSSFSDYAGDTSATSAALYCPASQKWYNSKTVADTASSPLDSFSIITGDSASVPTKIKKIGMPMKNIKLRGPSSLSFGSSSDGMLGDFTMAFFASFNTITFGTAGKIVIWRMYAETTSDGSPIMVELSILPNTTIDTEVKIRLTIGNAITDQREWSIPKSTLASTNMPTTYAISYESTGTRNAYFYAGPNQYNASPYNTTIDSVVPIRLTNTESYIGSWDGNLYAFVWYKNSLNKTAIDGLYSYFTAQWSGSEEALTTALNAAANATNQLNMTNTKLQDAENKLTKCLEDKAACLDKLPKTQPNILPGSVLAKWTIALAGDLGKANISDLAACSPLWVRSMHAAVPSSTSQVPVQPNNVALPSRYVISYPGQSTAGSQSIPITSTTTPTSNTTTNTPSQNTTTPTSNTTGSSVTQTSTTTITSNNKNTDLNQAYKDLVAAAQNTDKTLPGPGADLIPTTPATPTTTADPSIWDRFKGWLGLA